MKKIKALIKLSLSISFIVFAFYQSGCSASYIQDNSSNDNQQVYNLDELNNYGEWAQIEGYGRVWYPYAVEGWQPFDNGHWAYADANWTWISYEPFGWIVYHYGYWYNDPFYGWVWIPSDGIWSPANVIWADYGDYICWAPRAPHGVVYGRPWETNQDRFWHVVKAEDFTRDNIRDYKIKNLVRKEDDTRDVVNRPPDRKFVEKALGRSVNEVNLQHEKVQLPPREIQKINLPEREYRRVKQNTPRVRKEVLVPKEEFHKQQSERNNRKR